MNQLRVTVVGGGPAGASAAITLARAGAEVSLIDKALFPRDKCCGDGLTTGALRRLEELGFDPRTLPSWRQVAETVWRSPSGRTTRLPVPQDGVRMGVAKRTELDAGLLELARTSGARILQGHAVTGMNVVGTNVRVCAEGLDAIESDYVIAADGMWSPVRRMLDPHTPPYRGDIHAFRQYLRNVTGVARDKLWVSFEPELLPGYLWSFPVGDGEANVGFGIHRTAGQSVQWMRHEWADLLQKPHVREALGPDAQPIDRVKAWPIPALVDTRMLTAAGGRTLFVGDAARVVDPLTGEGIGQALETGALAASCIIDAGATAPIDAARKYRNTIRSGMAIDNAFARGLSKIVTYERGARAVLRLAPAGLFRGQYATRWVLEDNPRAALLTPWRWGERFRTKTGAFV